MSHTSILSHTMPYYQQVYLLIISHDKLQDALTFLRPTLFAILGLQPSSKLRNGLHGYCLECPKRVWNNIGWKITPATIPCLLPTGLISKNLGNFNSYVGSGTFLFGYELKKTDLHCIITMAVTKTKIYYTAKQSL